LEITADLSGQKVVDLAMARHRRGTVRYPVHVNGMFAAFSEELTAMLLKVPDEVIALHAA
jgi:hypothetical protein